MKHKSVSVQRKKFAPRSSLNHRNSCNLVATTMTALPNHSNSIFGSWLESQTALKPHNILSFTLRNLFIHPSYMPLFARLPSESDSGISTSTSGRSGHVRRMCSCVGEDECVGLCGVVGQQWVLGGNGGRGEVAGRKEALPVGHLEPRGQLLLPLGAPVLEPGLYLHLCQTQALGQLHAFAHAQILVDLWSEDIMHWVGADDCQDECTVIIHIINMIT